MSDSSNASQENAPQENAPQENAPQENTPQESTPQENAAQKNTAQETAASAPAPSFGWNAYAERTNGRFAMVGFVALLLLEWVTRENFWTWIGL